MPKSEDAAEGEDYLLAVVIDMNKKTCALNILDAQNVGAGPVAVAQLEHRVPLGFHGARRHAG